MYFTGHFGINKLRFWFVLIINVRRLPVRPSGLLEPLEIGSKWIVGLRGDCARLSTEAQNRERVAGEGVVEVGAGDIDCLCFWGDFGGVVQIVLVGGGF